MQLTKTEENYIKAIYKCGQQGHFTTTNALAEAIQIKASSVTDMLKKLKTKKLILYKPYEGCKLTTSGEKVAILLVRKHRLWETFLYNTLGFAWNEVHDIAEELEHINRPELVNRLDAFLGYPKTDPHGDSIPDAMGKIQEVLLEKLSNQPIGKRLVVNAVNSHERGILELLNHYNIKLQTQLEVLKHFSFDDSIEIKIDGKQQCVLPKTITESILVNLTM